MWSFITNSACYNNAFLNSEPIINILLIYLVLNSIRGGAEPQTINSIFLKPEILKFSFVVLFSCPQNDTSKMYLPFIS